MKKLVSLLLVLAAVLSFAVSASAYTIATGTNLPKSCKNGHIMVFCEETEPTCSHVGYKAHFKCTVCGTWFYDIQAKYPVSKSTLAIAKKAHSYGTGYKQNAECHWRQCRNCGYTTDAEYHVYKNSYCKCGAKDPHVHAIVFVSAADPTCDVNGTLEHYECEECGMTFRNAEGTVRVTANAFVVPAFGHDMEVVEAEDGNYFACKTCGRTFVDSKGKKEIVIETPAEEEVTEAPAAEAAPAAETAVAEAPAATVGNLISALTLGNPDVKVEDLLGALTDLEAPVTREQAAVILYRFVSLKGEVATPTDISIADASMVSEVAAAAVTWAVANDIMPLSEGGCFNPAGSVSAADVLDMITRLAAMNK